MRLAASLFYAGSVLGAGIASAGDITPVDLPPMAHSDALVTIVQLDGTERSYSPADLETLPTYQMTTTTPWRDDPAVFEGILLADLLRENGLYDVGEINVMAENDYATTMSQEVWDAVDIMVATRVDGRAHTRRARGPIQFVMDAEDYARSGVATESDLVWMVARIGPTPSQ